MPIIFPSNLEYLGSKPNFTRDSYDTLEEMQEALEAGHIDEGHLSYCYETGITYKAVRLNSGLVWKDIIGDLKRELNGRITDLETASSGALQDLDTRLKAVEDDLSGESGDTGSRLDQVWNWYDELTHVPALRSSWTKKDSGKLRRGTQHTYTVTFEWDWADRIGATGVMYKIGSSGWVTKTFEELGVSGAVAGGTKSIDVDVALGSTSITLSSKFNDLESHGSSGITVTPVAPSREWTVTASSDSWIYLNPNAAISVNFKVIGSYLSDNEIGNKIIGTDGSILKNITEVTDDDVTATETVSVKSNMTETLTMSWQTSQGVTVDSCSYIPQPGFFVISSQTDAWDETPASLSTLIMRSRGFQTWAKSASTTIPETEYTAGSTAIYLSQFNIRNLGVKSLAHGSDTWVTISGFSKSGTVTYLGKTYYYRLNPNIGAGIFSFKFA